VANPQPEHQTGAPTSQSDSGGSSPLVPILIAILALAGISLIAVMVRRRRAGGPSVSPKAS
jgi:hypothetical protein